MEEREAHATRSWHTEGAQDCAARLKSDLAQGLNRGEARERLAEHGANRLPVAGKRGPWLRFLIQFHNLLIYVLLVAAVASGLLGEWVDFGVILGVVFVNALIGCGVRARAGDRGGNRGADRARQD